MTVIVIRVCVFEDAEVSEWLLCELRALLEETDLLIDFETFPPPPGPRERPSSSPEKP